jgi:hypothetical protein
MTVAATWLIVAAFALVLFEGWGQPAPVRVRAQGAAAAAAHRASRPRSAT